MQMVYVNHFAIGSIVTYNTCQLPEVIVAGGIAE